MEPTEMLRYLQKKIVSGKPLQVTNSLQILGGETNFRINISIWASAHLPLP